MQPPHPLTLPAFARWSLALLVLSAIAAAAPAAEPARLHVAPDGSDAWSGALAAPNAPKTDGPFATLARARDEIRVMKKAGGLPAGGVVVELVGGRYELGRPLALTADDSGTADAPIVYRARPGGQPVRLSGGRLVDVWQPVIDPVVLKRIDPAARGRVVQADLRALGIAEYGDLALDAQWQLQQYLASVDVQNEATMGNASASRGKKVQPRLEVFFNAQPMPIAEGPGQTWILIDEPLGPTERNVRGHKSRVEGIFRYQGDWPERWQKEKEIWLRGSWSNDWAQQCHKVTSLDVEARVISVEPPYHGYGYKKGRWFRGFNMLAELDAPGEWCVDHQAGVLYFWPPDALKSGAAEVSVSPGLLTLDDVSHVTIQGMTLECARGTAVAIRGGRHCQVVGCTLRNLANHAVTVFQGHEHAVVGCDMHGMGGGGVYLIGGDRKSLTPGGHLAENNHIHHFGRWDRFYRPGIQLSGVGLRAAHNLIHHAPHAAIIFGGNDHRIEWNEIHSVCHGSWDCGAIYAGRSWTLRGHVIQYNYLHHLAGLGGGACRGVYLDDLFSSALVRGNVFYQVHWPMVVGGGRDNTIENNIFVDCPKALHIDARALGWCGPHADQRIKEAREKGTIAGVRFNEPPFVTRYPKLATLLDDEPKKPKGNVVRRNIFWQGDAENLRRVADGRPIDENWWDDITPEIRSLVAIEDNLINEDPRFVDPKTGNFQLRDDSPAWGLGFERIALEKIGLYQDANRASWPVQHDIRPLPTPKG